MYFGNKYIVTLTFDDFVISLEGIAIGVVGKVKVKFNKELFSGLTREQIVSMKGLVYGDMMPHIINNNKDFDKIKFELNNFNKPTNWSRRYEVLSCKIGEVYNIQQRQRKLKLEKINKLS